MNKITLSLQDLFTRLELDPGSRDIMAPAADLPQAIALLEEKGAWIPAIRVFGQALPPREAVWWACVSARANPDPAATPLDQAALAAADAWVRRPSEEHRRAAQAAADASGGRSPEAWAAMGAFWSGGSIAPPDVPEVAMPPHLCGVAVASSVMLAAVRNDPNKAEERYPRFLASARDIAQGGGG
jgi:hypothetical protein